MITMFGSSVGASPCEIRFNKCFVNALKKSDLDTTRTKRDCATAESCGGFSCRGIRSCVQLSDETLASSDEESGARFLRARARQ